MPPPTLSPIDHFGREFVKYALVSLHLTEQLATVLSPLFQLGYPRNTRANTGYGQVLPIEHVTLDCAEGKLTERARVGVTRLVLVSGANAVVTVVRRGWLVALSACVFHAAATCARASVKGTPASPVTVDRVEFLLVVTLSTYTPL